jgi:hypothetical protein
MREIKSISIRNLSRGNETLQELLSPSMEIVAGNLFCDIINIKIEYFCKDADTLTPKIIFMSSPLNQTLNPSWTSTSLRSPSSVGTLSCLEYHGTSHNICISKYILYYCYYDYN